MRSDQELLSELAYLRRSCNYLLAALDDVEKAASALGELDSFKEGMVSAETTRSAGSIKTHVDLATRYAEDWKHALGDLLT
ncbi:hypothetical protein [Amycolatopsis rifamycinica]|uniref:Uncharacterized protein n=1 Tax=Amycolatopsis rifamycinica TaxID=287986 RepID=A0A066UBA0_9PSEU|nr:hypothetical protein [Amycolatopsis rifamycinica]KDN23132.1 hypothetical protein DV20_05285 [Amycolatopsis rifamycinica]